MSDECMQTLSGPFASQLLADLGANVFKVERSNVGDTTRSLGQTLSDTEMIGNFTSLNRGKRSIALDLSNTDGAAAFERLVAEAD